MKIKQLKKWINSLPESEMDKELNYYSPDYCMSGFVTKVDIATEDLYWLGDDDPSRLWTLEELSSDGYTEEEIEYFLIEIHKGDYLIIF